MSDAGAGLPGGPGDRLAALQQLQWRFQSQGASVELLLELLHAAQRSQAELSSLFADIGDAPAAPTTADAVHQAAAWAAATVLHLQLMAQLVQSLTAQELGLEALASSAAAAAEDAPLPAGPVGSFVIEEMEADESGSPSAIQPVDAVLVAALYGADAQLQRPWAAGQVATAAQQLLAALAAKLAPLLAGLEQQQQQQQQGGAAPLLKEAATARTRNGGGGAGAARQPAEVQQLLGLVVPAALQNLQPVVAAKVQHDRHKTARLEPYTGPGNFERCVAASQLAWLVRQLSGRHLAAVSSAALPAVVDAIDDPFPAEQACGLWALQHLAAEGRPEDLRIRHLDVMGTAKHALAGCSDACWPAAAAAAIAVASRMEGPSRVAQAYHDIMAVFLDEGELGAHLAERAAAWLAAVPPLFPRLGLQLTAHFSRLMPLLLGWCVAPRQSVRAAALEALLEVIRLTWPRIGAHAAVLWRVLRRVYDEERHRPQLGAGGDQAAAAVADCAEDCALALWYAAGPDFHLHLMMDKSSAGEELLQAVMQRVEEAFPMAAEEGDDMEEQQAA